MQSPLFGYTETSSPRTATPCRTRSCCGSPSTGHDDVLARKGAMVAYQGLIEFDGEYQTQRPAARPRAAPARAWT